MLEKSVQPPIDAHWCENQRNGVGREEGSEAWETTTKKKKKIQCKSKANNCSK